MVLTTGPGINDGRDLTQSPSSHPTILHRSSHSCQSNRRSTISSEWSSSEAFPAELHVLPALRDNISLISGGTCYHLLSFAVETPQTAAVSRSTIPPSGDDWQQVSDLLSRYVCVEMMDEASRCMLVANMMRKRLFLCVYWFYMTQLWKNCIILGYLNQFYYSILLIRCSYSIAFCNYYIVIRKY